MFDALKQAFNKARRMLGTAFKDAGSRAPTRNEMRLDSDEWQAKQKLGKAFFTKRLTKNSRAARIASLTPTEYALASARGWF